MSELLQTMDEWRGRIDAVDGEAGRRWHQVVQRAHGRRGSRRGVAGLRLRCRRQAQPRPLSALRPARVRCASTSPTWRGTAATATASTMQATSRAATTALEAAQAAYAQQAATLLRAGHRVIGLGGGHEIAWASYQGIAAALHDDQRLARLGIVNFDAHFDLRQPEQAGRGTSGTPFLQIAESRAAAGLDFRYLCLGISETANTPALFARAAELGVEHVPDVDIADPAVDARCANSSRTATAIYCTFCLDVLPPAVAPGVSAPSGLGVPLHRAMALLRLLRRECRDAPGRRQAGARRHRGTQPPASTRRTDARRAPPRASPTNSPRVGR